MKKLSCLLILCIGLLCGTAHAQAFEKGDVMISPGIGLGLYGVGYGVSFTVPVVLNVDFGVHDYVSVGPYAGFWTTKWAYFGDGYRWTSTHVGARGSFHFWKLIDENVDADLLSEDLDVYVTAWLGYNLRTARYTGDGPVPTDLGWGNRFQGGAQIGVRYFFTDNIGVFGEWGGTPTSWSNIGMTFKF